ncbi:DNA-binding NarL/FixJ family response regulator/RecA/RadA recombinase [Kibdelosporangium banguiense]|uniref:DNA-binding NarL/FixJ family response regulator/RecA/RadA recombinase n=1 Tax=Kibdelosporangium banguiense TaxID=1365924 RepID=A0ABS4TSI4_9PSEU|nr:LuxR family transcriptional regulator [Kibdelosporangium banguiense]MBP2327375.1 DNA-binding NarL/FixJ family response regulator/RecA/RadA recombinase [Kibdelosporangium banguiense]
MSDSGPPLSGAWLAGRSAELAELDGVLRRLGSGDPQVVEIYGEPGIGKTRLLDALSVMIGQKGATLAAGRATEYENGVPFAVFSEAFDAIPAVLETVPEVVDGIRSPGRSGLERHNLYRAVRRMLAGLAESPGLALVLDDLHWADEASLELVEHLLRDRPPGFLLIALAYRTDQVPAALPAALARTRAEVTRLALGPLRLADVHHVVPGLPARRRRLLFQASGGNPLYLKALEKVDENTVAALTDPARISADDMPHRLQALLATELHSLDPTQLLVAQATAVAGDPADLDLVVQVAACAEDHVYRALDELVQLGVIHAAGSRFSFRHPLLRAAAYQMAGPVWRIKSHQRAEEFLRSRGGPLTLRAHHAAHAARYGDSTAASTLAQAAVASIDSAPGTAAEWLRVALNALPDNEESAGRRVELLLLLARALGRSGRLENSREILHQVLDLPQAPRTLAVRYCAVTERLLGRLPESRALLEAELGRSPTMADAEVAALLVELAGSAILVQDNETCVSNASQAVTLGVKVGDRGHESAGRTLCALAALSSGDAQTAREELETVVRLVDSVSDTELREHLHLIPPLGWLELQLEQYDNVARHVRRGLDIAHGSGHSHALPYLYIVDSAVKYRTGLIDQATQANEEARELSTLMGSTETLAMARTLELRSLLWQRGPEAALPLADLLAGGERPKSTWWAEVGDMFIATIHLFAGQPENAGAHVMSCVGDPRELAGLTAARWCGILAVAKGQLGQFDDALDLAEHALNHASTLGLSFQDGLAQLAYARVLGRCGQLTTSVDRAYAAAQSFAAARAPMYRALAHEVAAHNLAAAGDLQQARADLGLAKSGYSACGATWLFAQARTSEIRFGARAQRTRRPVGTVGALSGRELEVAQLVAAGLTNREIATRLYLSPKTVEAHLARVFTKLGVKSRVGVAQQLAGRSG